MSQYLIDALHIDMPTHMFGQFIILFLLKIGITLNRHSLFDLSPQQMLYDGLVVQKTMNISTNTMVRTIPTKTKASQIS